MELERQTETDTDRHRQTETDTDRQRQTETDRDTDRQRQTQTDTDRQRRKRRRRMIRGKFPPILACQEKATTITTEG